MAGIVCAVEALVLAGFAVFYVVQLATGRASDTARVLTEGALIALGAVGLATLARLWWGRSGWPATPTVVWHLLLVPVVVALLQSGQLLVGLLLAGAVVAAIGATMAARGSAVD